MRTDYLRIDVYCVAAEELIMYWFVCRIRRINCVLIRVSRWKNSFCVQAYEFFTYYLVCRGKINYVVTHVSRRKKYVCIEAPSIHVDIDLYCVAGNALLMY